MSGSSIRRLVCGCAWLLMVLLLNEQGVSSAFATQVKPLVTPAKITQAEGVKRVLTAVTLAAEANARLPKEAEKPGASLRRSDDALCEYLVQTAAKAALELPDELAMRCFLIAVGLALDDSDALTALPGFGRILGRQLAEMEDAEMRKRRIAALGSPTMRGRRDLCQHFALSTFLAVQFTPALAEAAGMAKELRDLQTDSGFSFDDLQADFAGIGFAKHCLSEKHAEKLKAFSERFQVTSILPDHRELPSGLSPAEFRERFGKENDRRFTEQVDALRKAVTALYSKD